MLKFNYSKKGKNMADLLVYNNILKKAKSLVRQQINASNLSPDIFNSKIKSSVTRLCNKMVKENDFEKLSKTEIFNGKEVNSIYLKNKSSDEIEYVFSILSGSQGDTIIEVSEPNLAINFSSSVFTTNKILVDKDLTFTQILEGKIKVLELAKKRTTNLQNTPVISINNTLDNNALTIVNEEEQTEEEQTTLTETPVVVPDEDVEDDTNVLNITEEEQTEQEQEEEQEEEQSGQTDLDLDIDEEDTLTEETLREKLKMTKVKKIVIGTVATIATAAITVGSYFLGTHLANKNRMENNNPDYNNVVEESVEASMISQLDNVVYYEQTKVL